jgi:FkbM family methyltransferase
MTIILGPCLGAAPSTLTIGEQTIATACYRLAAKLDVAFALLVDRHSQDDITQLVVSQQYTFPAGFGLLPALVQPGGRVLDLGAHIGTFSLYAAALGYNVTAVEANAQNVALLRASLQHNAFSQLRVIHAAVSDRAETVEFLPAGPYGIVANAAIGGLTVSVPAHPVDELLEQLQWPGVDFIKLDIEGSEPKAVRGMGRLLARADAPAILYESNSYTLRLFNETPRRLMAALEYYGYHCYLVEPGVLIPVRSTDFQPACSVDYLAIKRLPPLPAGWQIADPLSWRERNRRISQVVHATHPNERSCMAHNLCEADATVLGDYRIWRTLLLLQQDPDPAVRAAAAWWGIERVPRPLRPLYRLYGRWRARQTASGN